jgi:signal-transduction protein with cAMP-binding, CBS, and nucleotidyltransferase domain
MMQVGELLTDQVHETLTLPGGCSVQAAIEKMAAEAVEAVVVTADDRPVGIFSGPELLKLFQTDTPAVIQRAPLKEAMSDRFVLAGPEEEVRQVMGKMLNAEIRHLVVFSADAILGQIALCDIVKRMFEILDREIRHLNDYIADLHEAGTD